jgi:hypothetical protein
MRWGGNNPAPNSSRSRRKQVQTGSPLPLALPSQSDLPPLRRLARLGDPHKPRAQLSLRAGGEEVNAPLEKSGPAASDANTTQKSPF